MEEAQPQALHSLLNINNYRSLKDSIIRQQVKVESNLGVPTIAKSRWLKVSEIECLLDPETTPLTVERHAIQSPPQSGTLLLFNRNITRNYKVDGHQWIKNRNSTKVRLDHVKLRVKGNNRVAGFYAHSEKSRTMHRRTYYLLDPDTGSTATPQSKEGGVPSLVLVHYFDTSNALKIDTIVRPRSHSSRTKRKRCEGSVLSRSTKSKLESNGATLSKGDLEPIVMAKSVQQEILELMTSNWRSRALAVSLGWRHRALTVPLMTYSKIPLQTKYSLPFWTRQSGAQLNAEGQSPEDTRWPLHQMLEPQKQYCYVEEKTDK